MVPPCDVSDVVIVDYIIPRRHLDHPAAQTPLTDLKDFDPADAVVGR